MTTTPDTITAPAPAPDADQRAFELLARCRPAWTGMTTVREVLGEDRLLLHAGPPFSDPVTIPAPVLNSLALACVFEGWADDIEEGRRMVVSGEVPVGAAQDHDIVVPLAGAVSPSMALHVVHDLGPSDTDTDTATPTGLRRVRYAVLNEGQEYALRLGTADLRIVAHHSWLNGAFAEELTAALVAVLEAGPVELYPLMSAALAEGDECHSRTLAGSRLVAARLREPASGSASPGPGLSERSTAFLDGAGAFALNLWMAAASLTLGAAEGVADATLITRAGGNGREFGVQLAGAPGRWFTAPATPPRGPVEPAHEGRRALGAVGDSAVVDVLGFGGQALEYAPAVRAALGEHLPEDAADRPARLLARPFAAGTGPGAPCASGGAGKYIGTSAARITAAGTGPMVLLGMIEETGTHGRIGGGVFDTPVSLFQEAAAG
ncbi:DUF1116 domain-containing protein [Streptomyces sp. NBC_00841]|uniref:oxamate carbamoyltransferase subunit AllG family protein n=1 Tax=Streptomyces sp. NBC_00841 TaxID=2975847 RepID=UPI002DDBD7EC|nr:DUF1116 domain-containing protein [Streptomyces sp. NBC_00841]WRZ97136.1 DUF1116 domain-containing protein [Streptomyces sp. NBC_00841]